MKECISNHFSFSLMVSKSFCQMDIFVHLHLYILPSLLVLRDFVHLKKKLGLLLQFLCFIEKQRIQHNSIKRQRTSAVADLAERLYRTFWFGKKPGRIWKTTRTIFKDEELSWQRSETKIISQKFAFHLAYS